MDKLYYLEYHSISSPADLKIEVQSAKCGIISERLAKKLWTGAGEDGMTSFEFCLKALASMKIIVPVETQLLPSEFSEALPKSGDCYFMPSVRTEYYSKNGSLNSLYVTYETESVPLHKLAQFVVYLQERHRDSIMFKPTLYYNSVQFDWKLDNSTKGSVASSSTAGDSSTSEEKIQKSSVKITIVFRSEVVEVKVDIAHQFRKSNPDLTEQVYSVLKTACVHVFHQTSCEIPAFRYKLAILCPIQTHSLSAAKHYLTFRISETNPRKVYCELCERKVDVESDERLLWISAQYHGPLRHSIHHTGECYSGTWI